jgi:hypothetical protein
MPRRARFVALALILVSCGDSGWPDVVNDPGLVGPQVHTDSTQYQMTAVTGGISESVRVVYTNVLQRPVYFERCFPGDSRPMYDVVRAGPDSLTPLELRYVWGCVGGAPTGAVMPGATVSFDLDLTTFDDPHTPVSITERSGSMQIVLRLCSGHRPESGDCDLLDRSYRESNLFTLIPPPSPSPSP